MASTRKLIVQVVGDARSLSKTMKQVAAESMTFGDKVASSTKRMAVPAAAAFAGLSTAAVSFAKAAAEDQRSAALLAEQMRRTADATNVQIAATEGFISRLSMASGVADDELRPSLAQLVRATGDVSKSQNLLKTALDVSAGSGRSLSSVVQAISKASQGQFTALKRLGIPLDENIIKTKDFDAAMQVLTNTFGGQAAVAANTAEGKMRRFGVAINEAKESIGAALLPALEAVLPTLVGFAQWSEKNGKLIAVVGVAVAGFASAILIANVALKTWAVAAKVAALVNAGLASSYLAVQVATGVGIATALAAAGAIVVLGAKMKNAVTNAGDLSSSMNDLNASTGQLTYGLTDAQVALMNFIGPVTAATRAIQSQLKGVYESRKAAEDARAAEERRKQAAIEAARAAASAAQSQFSSFKSSIAQMKESLRSYVSSVAQSITSSVSLQSAFAMSQQEQADAAQAVTDALERRRSAYEALNQAKQTGDAVAYAQALDEVAASEAAVSAAQAVRPRDYTSIFRAQIDAAKNFAGNLKALIATGNLSRSALQQLLALGPVAGAQVAQDLLNGVNGFTAASLSSDLASLEATASGVGMAMPGVSELLGSRVGGTANNYYITVQAGVGDKAAIAKEIVELLKIYNRSNGAIPVKVK